MDGSVFIVIIAVVASIVSSVAKAKKAQNAPKKPGGPNANPPASAREARPMTADMPMSAPISPASASPAPTMSAQSKPASPASAPPARQDARDYVPPARKQGVRDRMQTRVSAPSGAAAPANDPYAARGGSLPDTSFEGNGYGGSLGYAPGQKGSMSVARRAETTKAGSLPDPVGVREGEGERLNVLPDDMPATADRRMEPRFVFDVKRMREAVVMSEILTRPAARRRGWRPQ